ncbi:MAG: glycosyltransferase family 9 protein [Desulfobacterales bacterium]|nr:glycosyltransferase family 9 protein [Desulfobacterales bacterium]
MQEKLLIIHQGAIGDIVSIFPAIIRLKEKFCRIDAICKKSIGELASSLKLIDKFYPVEAAFFSSVFSGKADLRTVDIFRSHDEIVLFSYSQELESIISGMVNRKTYRVHPRPDASLETHILSHVLYRLAENGLIRDATWPENDYFTRLPKQKTAILIHDRSKILIHPGSGSARKNWNSSNFIKTFKKIKSLGMNPEIILGPAEHNLSEIFVRRLPAGSKIHILTDLLDLMTMLKQSGGFIGNDSGISHLAAFTGIPTVVIFGPSSPKRWKPFGRSVEVLRPETDCSPCFETGKSDCKEMKCLDGITPEMVINAFLKIKR